MSLEYADSIVAQALKQAEGNQAKARQMIVNEAMKDPKLLQALTRHHMKGIVAYHVERVASGRATKPKQVPEKPQTAPVDPNDAFGKEILKAVASSSSAIFGMETYASPQKSKKQASQQHIDALRAMSRNSSFGDNSE